MKGIAANNKPLRDGMEIKGHNEAINIIMSLIKNERDLNETGIRSLHKKILGEGYYNPSKTNEGKQTKKLIKGGRYKTSSNHVETVTGEIHYYAIVEETPIKMKELVDWYNESLKLDNVNPVVLAFLFHHKFVEIHPFDDGNGRMTRLLTNFILLRFGYPVSIIKQDKRQAYYAALSQADQGELIPFVELVCQTIKESLEVYLIAINGGDINDENDLDKEIELFIKGFDKDNVIKTEKSEESVKAVSDGFLVDFLNELLEQSKKFDALFHSNKKTAVLNSEQFDLESENFVIGNNDLSLGADFLCVESKINETKTRYIAREMRIDDYFGVALAELNEIELSLNWKSFLKNKNQDNLDLRFDIGFSELKYSIRNWFTKEEIVSHYYHEIPSDKERKEVIRKMVKKYIIDEINKWEK